MTPKTIIASALMLLTLLLVPPTGETRSGSDSKARSQRYIIELQDPPLAVYEGQQLSVVAGNGKDRLAATAAFKTGDRRLNTRSAEAVAYLGFIAERHEEFRQEASFALGRDLAPVHQYRVATNGVAMDLTPAEAALLSKSPLVKSIAQDIRHTLETYAGPEWIGAGLIWDGDAGFPANRGEGVIVGVLDSGINFDHPSFANPSLDGYNHENPLDDYRGLCADATSGVFCNGKVIGVYDFVQDDPDTPDVVEENTNGRDNDGHGSHTASTAVGNPVNTFRSGVNVNVSGVAPRANLISYRVCYIGEPEGPDSGGCMGSAILSAIDQAVVDGVDVINYSIGSTASDPWRVGSIALAYLNARASGVFVATSAGNSGPNESTIGSPANAPWVSAVGNATHNVIFGSSVTSMTGGVNAPDDLAGASLTEGIGVRKIVHAKDYGNALCGTGEAELVSSCAGNTGQSNPWAGETPFNGEIVVCDRGTYGRVEKGKNVLLAGAGGYILANATDQGESVVADDHCLPATHIGKDDGDILREWLDSGTGHQGAISGYGLVESDSFGDQLNISSSRGPAQPPVADTLKPNLIAPGTSIYAASDVGQAFRALSGTSMSSPHIAGAAALLKALHPDWTPSQIASALETTATAELATDRGIEAADPHQRGAGRPQLGEAANAGLFLDVTQGQFLVANPAQGGDPRDLNLPGLVDSACKSECTFEREVTDQMGGGTWTATPMEFPAGVNVTVSPSSFTLGSGQTRSLEIKINVTGSGVVGDWLSGKVKLSASGSSDQFLTASVYSYGGDIPDAWVINDNRNGGWKEVQLSGLVGLPDATFISGGLVKPTEESAVLIEDPSFEDPYDGGSGILTTWHSLPQGALWLYAETLASTSEDLDLFVGRDDNGNGFAEESEELCASTSSNELELCNLYDLPPGQYWIIVQNWTGTLVEGDEATLVHAAVAPGGYNNFAATGPGIIGEESTITVRLSWDNINALPGEQYFGAVGIGTDRNRPNNVGVIPVRFNRTAIADAETFPLANGVIHQLALDANDIHDRAFIDVPPGVSSMTVSAGGADEGQNDALTLELKRLDFDQAFSVPPFAASAGSAPTLVSATGVGGIGPSITVIGVEPGRWYPVLRNSNDSPSAIKVQAVLDFSGAPENAQPGLWEPNSRPGLGQGYEYNNGGPSRAVIWYTYDEAGQPAWYISGSPVTGDNSWSADLLRFTNDGASQHSVPVGRITITRLGDNDQMFSYTLFGLSGSERMQPISPPTCPQISGSAQSYTGLWYRGADGLGGASVLVNATTQSQIHYLFDDAGMPRWLVAQDINSPAPTNPEMPMLQFSGYCAVCQASGVSFSTVGVLGRSFTSETLGSWTLDYLLESPLSGSAERTDQISKLTDRFDCQ